jgi:hypothetical protein
MMSVTLGIDDEDAVDIVRDLEKSFDIVISDSEAASCRTLGDVFEMILERYRENGLGGRSCGSAMAFYRVRRGIEFIVPGIKLRPDMLLRDITPVSTKRLFQIVEARTGLRLPPKSNSWIGLSGAAGVIAGFVGAIPAGVLLGAQGLEIAGVLVGIGLLMVYIDPGKFPEDCNTIADLSKRVAKLNVGHLAKAGARAGEKELWDTLTEVASRYSSVPIAMMNPKSLLLRSQRAAA